MPTNERTTSTRRREGFKKKNFRVAQEQNQGQKERKKNRRGKK